MSRRHAEGVGEFEDAVKAEGGAAALDIDAEAALYVRLAREGFLG